MSVRRPPIYRESRSPDTVEQRVTRVERTTADLPDATGIWSTDRTTSGFGSGAEPTWSHTGDGSTVTFSLTGRISTAVARYRVTVGGVLQTPDVYSLPTNAATVVFVEAPPSGLDVHIVAPFYGI